MSSETAMADSLDRARHIAIIHHWDADGIASAATIIDRAKRRGIRCTNAIPRIGDYADLVTPAASLDSAGPDLVLGLDLAVSAETLEAIRSKISSALMWVDHHSVPPRRTRGVEYYHPSNSGLEGVDSNASFLARILDPAPPILAAIGTCGDLGRTLLSHPAMDDVRRTLSSLGLSFDILFEITELVDANYRADRPGDVRSAPWMLAERLDSPRRMMGVKEWRANKDAVDGEIHRVMASSETRRRDVLVKTISTPMHLTSMVARAAAILAPDEVKAVIVSNVHPHDCPFYVRAARPGIDLTGLIDLGRSLGYSAGGKPEAVGMVVPCNQVEDLTEKVLRFLEMMG